MSIIVMNSGANSNPKESLEMLTLGDIRPGWGTIRTTNRIVKGKIKDRSEERGDFRVYIDVGVAVSIILSDVAIYRNSYHIGSAIINYIQNIP